MRTLFIIAILCTGLIEENALLVGWEVDAQKQQSVFSHTIKKLHIASQGNTTLTKNRYNVSDKLAKAWWNVSLFSMQLVIIV